ncbi:MAG: alpha/beta fold hydrolase [Halothiobacillus sp.]
MADPQSLPPAIPQGIVLVSGWSFTAGMWRGLIDECMRQGLPESLITVVDWFDMGRWLFDKAPCPVAESLQAGQVIWMGWSLGGSLMLEAMARNQLHPTQAIIVSAWPRFLAEDLGNAAWPGVPRKNWRALRHQVQRDSDAALVQFDRWLGLPDTRDCQRGSADLVRGLDWLAAIDQRVWLETSTVPITWVCGTHDPLLPLPQCASAWPEKLQTNPANRWDVLAEGGHAIPWSHRNFLIELLLAHKNKTRDAHV